MRSFRSVVVLVAAISLLACGSAAAAYLPSGSTHTHHSVNWRWTGNGWPITCTHMWHWTTPSTSSWPNPSVPADATGVGNGFQGCSPSATITPSSQWTIKMVETTDFSNANETTTANVTLVTTAGTTINIGTCVVTFGAATATGVYTDGSTSLSLAATGVSFTASGLFCPMGTSGTASMTANYTDTSSLTIT